MELPLPFVLGIVAYLATYFLAARFQRQALRGLTDEQKLALVDLHSRQSWIKPLTMVLSLAAVFALWTRLVDRRGLEILLAALVLGSLGLLALGQRRITAIGASREVRRAVAKANLLRLAGLCLLLGALAAAF